MLERQKKNPEDWRAKEYFNKPKKKKRCSYCEGIGHTRPTCKELKHAKEVAIEKCRDWRSKLVGRLREMGIGVGSLVQYESWSKKIVGVIAEVNWNKLTHLLLWGELEPGFALSSADLSKNHRTRAYLPVLEGVFTPEYQYLTHFSLLSPISPEQFDRQVPAGFLTAEDCIETIFKEKEAPKYKTTLLDVSDWCPKQGFYE
jgi:hypothetical protein